MVTRLSGGLTPADGADPRTFPAIWNSAADEIDAKVVKDSQAGAPFLIWGAESASTPALNSNLSMGNGETTGEIVMPHDGSVTKLTMYSAGPSGTNTLQIIKNGTLQGSSYQISSSAATATQVLASPLTFVAGDSINLQFTAVGGGPVVGSMFGFWD